MSKNFSEIFADYKQYLEKEKLMSARSVKDYLEVFSKVQARVDLLSDPSYKQVNDAVKAINADMEAEAVRRGRQPESVRATLYKLTICLRAIAKWLHREELTSKNVYPFSEWRKPRPVTPRFLTVEQFEKLIDDPMLPHQEETMLHLFWESACRLAEGEALTQDDFFFDQKFFLDDEGKIEITGHYVRISWEISKGHYSNRNVPISDRLKDLLLEQFGYMRRRGHDKTVFLGANNQPITKSGIYKALHNIGMRQSPFRRIMHISPHMFRHSFGIRMLERGLPEVIVQKLLGHESLTMTSRYVNMTADSAMRIFVQKGLFARRPEAVSA